MPHYRDLDAHGRPDEVIVIEDATQVLCDASGQPHPGYTYINAHTIRAHPLIIEVLLQNAEPLWTLDEVLAGLGEP